VPRLISGKISYCLNPPGKPETEFGREVFSMSVQANGLRTLRVLCEFDDIGLTRDVTYTVDADWHPVEAYVRIAEEDRALGSGWFRFTDTYAEGEGFTVSEGRFHQRISLDRPLNAFGSHPICSDIWKLARLPKAKVGETVILDNAVNTSPLASGESGPIMAMRSYPYVYKGEETIEVRSGTNTCQRWDWPVRDGKTLCMWTTAGEDFLPIRMTFPEGNKIYDLVELNVRD
jgi:hypothetical protein